MVVIFVALTIVALLALDYFIIHPRQQRKEAEIAIGEIVPLSKTLKDMPAGVFLQPTFTWTKMKETGGLVLGLHPLILGLIGPPYEIELLKDKESVKKGEPLFRINKNGRYMTIKSPVDGEIRAFNQALLGETDWEELNESWLYRIAPQNVSAEVPQWHLAEEGREWARDQYQKIKSYLYDSLAPTDAGITLADGGDVPVGVLSELNDDSWKDFQKKFLS